MAHHTRGAPLVTISSIVVFLVVVTAAGGATGRGRGKFSTRGRAAWTATLRATLQAPVVLVEDLEEQHGGTIVLKMDGEGPLSVSKPADLG